MSCEEVKDLLIANGESSLNAATQAAVSNHLRTCAVCRQEKRVLDDLLQQLASIPPELPDQDIKAGFLQELEQEKAKLAQQKTPHVSHQSPNRFWIYAGIAASFALLIAGFTFFSQQRSLLREMAALEREYHQLNKMVALSLIEDQSASKRLQAVRYATALPEQDLEIVAALIDKMQHDKHVNVRLAAANALARFANDGSVINALIKALKSEQNANMQLELIQILVDVQEKRAIPIMHQLLKRDAVPAFVKEQINLRLNQIS